MSSRGAPRRQVPLREVALADKYLQESGRVYLTGAQALVRMAFDQKRRDRQAGLNTAGFISGYRGSPVGVYDQELWRAREHVAGHDITFRPGLNEEIAATSVWGSQQTAVFGKKPLYDGVFAAWYGKNPGVDRAGDALKHGNFAGSGKNGGVLMIAGDDHAAKSSDLPNQSDFALMNFMMPTLFPSDVQDVLDFAVYGWAMSRFSGCWTGFKVEPHIMDRSQTVEIGPERIELVTPGDYLLPPGGLNLRWPDNRFEQEVRMLDFKLPAARAFVRANAGIDRVEFAGPARIGIVTTGKSYLDVREALDELGIDELRARRLGLRLYKVGLTWPLEPEGARRFCEGLEELVVVEEKQPVIENQLRAMLYDWPAAGRPRIVGKTDGHDASLLTAKGDLEPLTIADVIANRILRMSDDEELRARLGVLEQRRRKPAEPAPIARKPYFCSGCPHSSSLPRPDGTRAAGGIGCHWMAVWTPEFATEPSTQMGGEGAQWIGQAPFVGEDHLFQNLGDGTYYHSGSLAIRAAVASGVNITYKLLYNDAVAMTGGQPVEGSPSVQQITRQLLSEGVKRVVVVSDEPEKYAGREPMAESVTVHGRGDMQQVQDELTRQKGVSVLVYDQTCAAEKRRRRKRGSFPDPAKRMFINELVCEGCGDCGRKSNCISVEPVETEFGRKRMINQSSCNKDYSCNKGFCPSFVSVDNAVVRKRGATAIPDALLGALPEPEVALGERPHNLLITGIGGTGIVTLGALLGVAAHVDGRASSVLDSIGLAQKNGAVVSHVRIAGDPGQLHSARVPDGSADGLIACDLVVAADQEVIDALGSGHTRSVVNEHIAPTADFVLNPDLDFRSRELRQRVAAALGRNQLETIDAQTFAFSLMGDAIAMNLFMLGHGFQNGLIPISSAAIMRAIELNGVSVEMNKQAFLWGRIAAHDIEAASDCAHLDGSAREVAKTLDDIVRIRVDFLRGYQGESYARRYAGFVETVRLAEQKAVPGSDAFTVAVAKNLFKLMAYKDEYEVARLYTDGSFMRSLTENFEDGFRISFNFSPPLIGGRDPFTGERTKRSFGPWMLKALKLLSRLRGLRGTPFDPFGYQEERRMERRLIGEYEKLVGDLAASLDKTRHDVSVRIAAIPQLIRGYGHVKRRSVDEAMRRQAELLESLDRPGDAAAVRKKNKVSA